MKSGFCVVGVMSFFDFASLAPYVEIFVKDGVCDCSCPLLACMVRCKDRGRAVVVCFLLYLLPSKAHASLMYMCPSYL